MRFHQLNTNLQPPVKLNNPFDYQPHPLSLLAAEQVSIYIKGIEDWQEEIAAGKMFGVLVCQNMEGELGFIAAYSGQLGGRADWPWFVPAVFDYLQPDSYFKQEEGAITAINHQVETLENSYQLLHLRQEIVRLKTLADVEVNDYKEVMRKSKEQRAAAPIRTEAMTRESQFQKAELRRLKGRWKDRIAEAEQALSPLEDQINQLKQERKRRSDALQQWLFGQFIMLNGQGERQSLLDIFAPTSQGVPPSGAGECCAPRLLQYALNHHLRPLCMAEFWQGASPKMEIRHHGQYYPACRGKCLPILSFMLQGLEVEQLTPSAEASALDIIYADADIVVVNKPSGMLSVPGKTAVVSVYDLLKERYPQAEGPIIVHRLDMDTSGIMVAALTLKAYHHLQKQFINRTTHKEYIALVQAKDHFTPGKGQLCLPLRADIDDRPRQLVDFEHGRHALTTYEVLSVNDRTARLRLVPHTGRTHQLRVHCAHHQGLHAPILGDNLYGQASDRLYLHAEKLSFTHPTTSEKLTFCAPVPF
ncbi:pseudouridine synthase [Prevotella sp. E13-17]|uniref:RluA family pseudouridine synthase n=1 Tax=Prevotella sp. E13-17 TaxID=2913616 RepID=UPI001EDA9D5A|nr:RluA family pseudouridine synthase [Prevotella sp. E13-17]UKK50781.1 pseudouridine synthase [Prevotella sp. E13-17]